MNSKNLLLVMLMLFSISFSAYAEKWDITNSEPYNFDYMETERSFDLPFNESWESGDFETNLWTFDPENPGNWQVVTESIPWPVQYAEFQALPVQTDYEIALLSEPFNGLNETDIYLKFDLELSSAVNTGGEEFSVEIFNGSDWSQVMNYNNSEGDFELFEEGIDISEYACGTEFQVRFVANGSFSEDIDYWKLDNISLGAPPPGGISGTVTDADTGEPVAGVQLTAGIYSGYTNDSGHYAISYLTPGIYELAASKNGYEEVIIPEVTVETGEDTIVDLTMIQMTYFNLPFNEHWESADFSTNLWSMDPAEQNNWQVVVDYLPWPVRFAEFSGDPELENYSNSLISYPINATGHDEVILDYRLDLALLENTGSEIFSVEINNGSGWVELMTYDNSESNFENLVESVDISDYASEQQFLVRFTASGTNSLNIDYWHLDYVEIHAPLPGSIYGLVTDTETSEIIANAEITIGEWQTVSNFYGVYNINNIIPGTYDVICNAEGYNDLIVSGVEILSNEITLLDLQLETEDLGQWDIYDLSNSGIPAEDVYAVLIAPDNTKWVGTFSGGLASYNDESWEYYYNEYATIRCIAREDNGNIWIGSGNGAAVFNGSNWTEYTYGATPIPYPVVTEITIDADNVKWIGTGFGGMASFDGSNWEVFDTNNSQLPDNIVYTISIDQDGVKWIGTQWGGLTSYNGSEWISYNTGNSEIPDDTVYDIDFDDQNNIWMATYGGGVACFDGSIWSVYNVDNSNLPSNYTQEIMIDNQNNIWVGTEEGLAKYDGEAWYSYNSTNSGLTTDNILSLGLDAESRLWIGTYEGGLCCYQESALGTVTGTVTDAETNEAIENAVITDGYFSLAETGADGSYSFDKIPGTYEVTCTKDGYNTLTIPDLEILSGETITLDLSLLAENLNSPAAPTGVTVTPDAGGILVAEIAWTCPTTTIGGTALTDLDEMRVYRDGTLIFTDTSPTIGGTGSHIDSSMLTSGIYIFGVVGFNDAGEGITVEDTLWIGEDVPAAVDNLVLAQTSPGALSGTLTWDNPTSGLHGGTCNNVIGGYHIERNDGVLFEISGSTTSFIDDTIPITGSYCYTVVPYNLIGDGGSATSNLVLIGAPGLLILEDFSDGVPPADWYVDGMGQSNWGSATGNNAGGTETEMMFSWEPPFNGISRMCTMTLDTSNMTEITVEFKHCVDDYEGGYTLGVATSSDGTTWNDVWTVTPTGAIGPETINVDITSADVGSTTFQMCFFINGDSFGINYWYIDDVMLTSTGIPTLDPPTNLAVDEDGLFTWDAPDADSTVAKLNPTPVKKVGTHAKTNGEKVFADEIEYNVNSSRELESYNVYLDGVLVGNTVDLEWLFSDLTNGQTYAAGVQAVYDDGESDIVIIEFTYIGTNANNDIIAKTELTGNYPNPFNPETKINFSIAEADLTEITIYNLKGQKVRTLIKQEMEAGNYSISWNGKDEVNRSVSSGIYYCRLQSKGVDQVQKMTLIK